MKDQTDLLAQALNGNKQALETLLQGVQGLIYNLSVRFFWNPMDAEDATQEILIKIMTHLSGFKNESAFETWCYRLAVNYLLNATRKQTETLTFAIGASHLKEGLTHPDYAAADSDLLAEEVKIGCSTSMLVCLSRPLRLAYILGEIFEFDGHEGATILAIEPAAFRKRLSQARGQIRQFMSNTCGIYNPKNPCRCSKQINYDLTINRIDPDRLLFADKGTVSKTIVEIEQIGQDIAIFQSHPIYRTPQAVLANIRSLITSGKYAIFSNLG